VKRIGLLNGCPSEVMRDDGEVEQMRAQRAEQQAEMAAKQDAMLAADVASKVPTQAAAA
jgi:hypothetical protein